MPWTCSLDGHRMADSVSGGASSIVICRARSSHALLLKRLRIILKAIEKSIVCRSRFLRSNVVVLQAVLALIELGLSHIGCMSWNGVRLHLCPNNPLSTDNRCLPPQEIHEIRCTQCQRSCDAEVHANYDVLRKAKRVISLHRFMLGSKYSSLTEAWLCCS